MNLDNTRSGSRIWELLSDGHRPIPIPSFPTRMEHPAFQQEPIPNGPYGGGLSPDQSTRGAHDSNTAYQVASQSNSIPPPCWVVEPFNRQSYVFRFCPNATNMYHRCSGYCAVRYFPVQDQGGLDQRVYPNITNPYHRHMLYCMSKYGVQLDAAN